MNKDWHWSALSAHPSITIADIASNPELNWNYVEILRNPNLTYEDVKNLARIGCIRWFIIEYNLFKN
jgi:hypothetical protein